MSESNRRHPGSEPGVLPTELNPLIVYLSGGFVFLAIWIHYLVEVSSFGGIQLPFLSLVQPRASNLFFITYKYLERHPKSQFVHHKVALVAQPFLYPAFLS